MLLLHVLFTHIIDKSTAPYKYVGGVVAGLVIIAIRTPYKHELLLYVVLTCFVVFLNLLAACMSPGYLSNTLSEVPFLQNK